MAERNPFTISTEFKGRLINLSIAPALGKTSRRRFSPGENQGDIQTDFPLVFPWFSPGEIQVLSTHPESRPGQNPEFWIF